MLKLIDPCVVQIVGMQDFLDEFRLCPDFWDICHAGHAADLFHQILPGFLVGLAHQIGKFNAVHQRVKTHSTGFVHIRLEQRRHFLFQMERILIAEGLVARRVGELLHIPQVLPHSEVLSIQLLHLREHFVHQLLSEGNQFLGLVGQILELVDDLSFQIEDGALQGRLVGSGLALVHSEEFEVAAQVEDVELGLVLPVYQPRTQTGAPADHLPEFRFAHDLLEKHQIQHLGHINASVQHVHGDGDLGKLLGIGELVDGALGVGHVVVDDLGIAGQVGILFAEDFQNFFGVAVVLGEDDGLAQLLPVVDLQSVGHQQVQGQTDGVLVEQPLVEGGGLNPLGQLPVLVGEGGLILRLLLLGQIGVGNALLQEFQFALHGEEVHQEAVLYRLGQFVAVSGYAALQFKDFIGILVDLVLGGGSEAYQGRVKVVENVPVLAVDGTVGLVADHQIEMAYGK